ncbi:GIY-YIG nuclease family protein [Algoriphagus lutimaris]|uniref:GIY-YIG nuclease family protein n=1 Tax=Algoriphagus lutimaris TaxID=613197 RepID=UPI00196AFC19|nr:GIY-YIG nuclease family protein [Algoriphagus lutimaris]MBN3519273.1 GIY-YIG nuclease family protein [Algoriphagus lutimaris]
MAVLFFVYILYSGSKDRYYIGQTENLEERLFQHNSDYFKNSHTHGIKDWKVVHKIACSSRKQAVNIELHIKRARKRKYLEDLQKYPEISRKLVEHYTDATQ